MASLVSKDDVGFVTTMMFSTTVCPACGKLRSADQLSLCLCGGLFCGIADCPSHIDCPCGIEGCDLPAYLPALGARSTRNIALCAVLVLIMLTGLGLVRHEHTKTPTIVHHATGVLPGFGYMPINR